MKKTALLSSLLALSLNLSAGDWGKAPVDKAPIEECVDLGASINAGYVTDYLFYGIRYAGDSVWTDMNYTFDGLLLPVTISAWYLNGINEDRGNDGNYDELRLIARAKVGSFAGFDVDLGYTHYMFPEFRSNVTPVGGYGEIGLDIRRSVGFADVLFESNYAMGNGSTSPSGWFHQLGLERAFEVTDSVKIVLGGGVGYTDGYFTVKGFVPNRFSPRSSGWNHYFLRASLPVQLNCRTTLSPYIGYNGGPDTWIVDGISGSDEPQTDILNGGVTLNVQF
jgi:hypothetical protein